MKLTTVLCLVVSVFATTESYAKETFLVIVAGLGGEERYRERFHDWSMAMRDAALTRNGLAEDRVFYLAEKPEMAPDAVHSKSTKENITALLDGLTATVKPGDQIYILLIGHGSFGSDEPRFNLPGPDLTATELDILLKPFGEQQIIFVNTASASGGFLPIVSAPNRIVVTSTKTGFEKNESQFGGFFVEAYSGEGADTDKNERISLLEAYNFARVSVGGWYDEQNILKTEHSLLDDTGKGEGVHDPGESAGDYASATYLLGAAGASEGFTSAEVEGDPELKALLERKTELEGRVEGLRLQKDSMPEDLYLQELETLLVELAEVTASIDARQEP